jgi:hypothetical protein
MLRKIFFFALSLIACGTLRAQQVSWQFDKGPYFARIHDFAVGLGL